LPKALGLVPKPGAIDRVSLVLVNLNLHQINDYVEKFGTSGQFNGALRKLNFQVFGRISVVMSTFSEFGLSYGRSNNEFWHISIEIPGFDPLLRNEKLCGNL